MPGLSRFFAYSKFASMTLKENTNFRVNFFLSLFLGFLSAYARVAVWVVIVHSGPGLDPVLAERTIQYMLLSAFAVSFLHNFDRDPVFNRVQSGDIARELLYPVSLPGVLFARGLGSALFSAMLRGLLTLAAMSLIFRVSWNIEPARLGLFVLFLLAGFVIQFLLSFQVDMLAFWVYETTALHYIKNAVADFFSGSLIPLWFYPPWIMGVLNFLPFKNTVYVPAAFLIGELPLSAAPFQLFVSLGWCLLLSAASALMWRAGLRKVVINGG
jgi:ABC-2 type transport system permease protein